jgi:zinc protease
MSPKVYKNHLNALPGPDDITRVVLPNGITILTRSNFNSPTLSIKGYLASGSIFDPVEKLGLSYLTAHGLLNGTQRYDFQSLYNEIESVGARLSFSAGTLTTSFSAHCLSEDLSLMMRLIADSLLTPTFPQREFQRQKTQLLTGLAIRAQDTSAMASLMFDQIIFADHPYQHPDEGYPETVQALTNADIIDFYQRTIGPKGMVIVAVGAVDPEDVIESVTQVLGDWSNETQQPLPSIPEASPLGATSKKALSIPGKSQADIVMGFVGPNRLSPAYFPLRVGNNILGEFGMMGRLGKRVREEAGLAYYAYSSYTAGLGPGAIEMIAGVNPANIDETIALMTDEMEKFIAQPVTEEELADSKSYYLGRMPLLLESNSGVAVSLMNMERFDLGLDYFYKYPQKIQKITSEDILLTSQRYLDPEKLAISVAGP